MNKYIKATDAAEIISEKNKIPLGDLVDIFAEIPTADVVEVVRCKDCKYFKMMGTTPRCNFYKGLATTVNSTTDYCSYGERKEE